MLPNKISFVDIETTGLSVIRDRIIEIGILRVEDNHVIKTYQSLINPEIYISPIIESITGISKDNLVNAPTFDDIKEEILELLDGSTFVAHNVRFDYGFLRNEFLRINRKFSSKHFCTAKLSRKLFPNHRHHNLDAVMQRFNITCERRHRAFDDAKVLWNFYEILQKQIPALTLEAVIAEQIKKPTLPVNLSIDTIEKLPETPGVYIFYADKDIPLYVGKSKNIKERVLSHFSNDYLSTKEMNMCQQVTKITCTETCGELGALIKESILIKELQPIYNRTLRVSKKLVVLKKSENIDGYSIVSMENVDFIHADDMECILGIYRSRRQAKNFLIRMAKEYILCEKLLGLEKSSTACFSYRLDLCKGACLLKEKVIDYNIRFIQAFSQYKLRAWPFQGPIAIKERNAFDDTEESIIVDKWCLLSNIKMQDDICVPSKEMKAFDLDIYKILVNFLQEPKNEKYITSLMPLPSQTDNSW